MTLLSNLLLYQPGYSGFSSYVRRVMPGLYGYRLQPDPLQGVICTETALLPHQLPSSRRMALLNRLSLAQHGVNLKAVLASAGLRTVDLQAIYSPYCDALLAIKTVPQIITCHDLTPLFISNSRKAAWRYRYWTPRHLQQAERVIAISHFVADQLIEFGLPADKLLVIANGVAIERLPIAAAKSHNLVVLARHDSNKNIAFVIKAFKRLLLRFPDWRGRLVIIGRMGRETARLQALCRDLERPDRVRLIEAMDHGQLVDQLRGSLALISASLMEGFDYPVIEAKAEGLPTLVSDIPVHQEFHADSSLFFNPQGEGDDLIEAILALSRDAGLWNQLSLQGLNLARSMSIKRQQEQIRQAIASLIG